MEELNGTVAQSTDLASSFPIELKNLPIPVVILNTIF